MRMSDWSSDVCSSDLLRRADRGVVALEDGTDDAPQPQRRRQCVAAEAVEHQIGHIGVAGADRQIVGDAVDRKGAVALVELQALGVLPAHLGVRTLVRIVRQALEIERSEERRVGKMCVSPCRSRWSPYHSIKKYS